MKTALIFGSSGQAGYYLGEFLTRKGYDVHTTVRRHGELTRYLKPNEHYCQMTDIFSVERVISEANPDEVYNLAAKMFVPSSWQDPVGYMLVNALTVSKMLEVLYKINPEAKFFQAGSADVFDQVYPMSEETPIRPRSPYGVSKATAQELVRVYREEKNVFACTGILFNFESPRRANTFFSMRVVEAVARMRAGLQDKLELGQLDAVRDWGLTEEYVEAMWMMLQAPEPKDYVIGTGVARSCMKFVERAFTAAELDMNRLVYDKSFTIGDSNVLWSDPRKIRDELGWEAKTKFPYIVDYLVEAEMKKLESVHAVRSV